MELKFKRFIFLLLTAFFCCNAATALVQAQDQNLKGLWHVYGVEEKGTLFFLIYDGEQSRVYDPDWKRVETSLQIEGDTLRFELPQVHYRHKVEARFKDGALTGTYLRPHPQYPWKGKMQSHRVTNDPDWDPWSFLTEARGSVINPWPQILKEAPTTDLAAFRDYWTENIEPRYYALFTHSLYANASTFFLPQIRTQAIEQLYAIISQERDEIEPLVEDFKSQVSEVFADLKEQYSWMRIPGIVFPLLQEETYDFTVRVVNVQSSNSRPFLIFNAKWMAENLSGPQTRYLLAQGMLEFEHESRHGIANFLRNAVARRGIVAYLASKLDYSDSPVDYLFQPQGASEEDLNAAFARFMQTFAQNFNMHVNRVDFHPFRDENRASAYLFAYGFAVKMSDRFSDEQLALEFDYERLPKEMAAYAQGLKARPAVAKPAENTASQPGRGAK
ncbi:MAG TPA: hypothetical protein VLV83_00155 [Acidobacteriota bacterium]|nr:hypothetical protein [Acidobacteriota bacterium]